MLFGKKEENSEVKIEEMRVVDKPYIFRKLKAKDIIPMCTIITYLDVKDMAEYFTGVNRKNGQEEAKSNFSIGVNVVAQIIDTLLRNLPKCEKKVFEFLSSISNLTPEQVEDLDLGVFIEMLTDFVKKDEFAGFMKVVSSFLDKQES